MLTSLPSPSSVHKQKVKVVIEVEICDSGQPAKDHYEIWGNSISEAEEEAEKQHNQALLTALRSNQANYIDFIKTIVVGSIESLEINREVTALAKMGYPYSASMAILQKLFPQLPVASQQYFQQASNEGWLSESIELIFNTIWAHPINLTVEYP